MFARLELHSAFDRNAEKFNQDWTKFVGFCQEMIWRRKIDKQPIPARIQLLLNEIDGAKRHFVNRIWKRRLAFAESQRKWRRLRPITIPR